MFRRHPFLSLVGIFCLIVLTAAAVFVATFDLNRYRTPLQAELSRRLSAPVQVGEAQLSLRHGPAVEFSDLTVGPRAAQGTLLRVKHLYLQPEFWPLFEGRLVFAKVVLDTPRLRLVLHPHPAKRSPLPSLAMFRSLSLRHGSLRLVDRRLPGKPLMTTLEEINGTYATPSSHGATRIQLTAKLAQGQGGAPLSLAARITPGPRFSTWSHSRLDLNLAFRDVAPGPFLRRCLPGVALSAQGRATLQATLRGTPASGLAFTATLAGSDLALRLPRFYRRALEVKELALHGTWITAPGSDRFEGLALDLDGLKAQGHLNLEEKGRTPYLQGTLSSTALPLVKLIRYLPDIGLPPALAHLEKGLQGGTLQIDQARFSGPLAAFRRLGQNFPLQSARATLKDGVLSLPGAPSLSAVSMTAVYADRRLTLQQGKALLDKTPIRYHGTLKHPFLPAPRIALTASGVLPMAELIAQLPRKMPRGLVAGGTLPLVLTLGGTPRDLLLHLRADLKPLALRFRQAAAKPAGMAGDLALSVEISPGRLAVKWGRLQLPPLALSFHGAFEPAGKRFHVAVALPRLKLEKLPRLAPILKKFRFRGEISIRYRASGSEGKVRHGAGTLVLHNFGMRMTRIIADLNRAKGRIRLSSHGAQFKDISARIGTSPVLLAGTLNDFSHPRLQLQAHAATIGGKDLYFFSKSAHLHQVEAHLILERNLLSFAPVTVRLQDGTKAVIRGSVRDFKQPRTDLDIESDRANIDQIIALWHGPPSAKKPKVKKHKKATLFILAKAKTGTLGALHFEKAEAEITHRKGALLIHHLHFHAGKGYCTGQVVIEHEAGSPSPPLLKISGHLENFDAAAIYRQLLRKQGLITGSLNGDFYLQGRAGKDFLPTSLGGFNMEVKHGVLHKFQFLSKVFSLLNVSQILSLKLPDMSLEGMPFTLLKASFTLRHGDLSTKDLVVDSNAMNLSLVGDMNLQTQKVNLILGVKPLKTVDKIISHIPIAGWLLTGKKKALITAYFKVKGKSDDPEVVPIPITTISDQVLGVFKRIFGLPEKVFTDMGGLLGNGKEK